MIRRQNDKRKGRCRRKKKFTPLSSPRRSFGHSCLGVLAPERASPGVEKPGTGASRRDGEKSELPQGKHEIDRAEFHQE